jgi:hypothetical protein
MAISGYCGTSGNIYLKCNAMQKMGAATMDAHQPKLSTTELKVALMRTIKSKKMNFSG